MAESWDDKTRETVKKIALLSEDGGPRDKEAWGRRLKQELSTLIQYVNMNKESDTDWFTISPSQDGTHWSGKCWYVHELIKYEFDFQFDIPATYPLVSPEIEIPELEGKTAKMYRGGKICLTTHFKPLWSKNASVSVLYVCNMTVLFYRPKFGIAHAMCLGLAPWLAAEVPYMVELGVITPKT